MQHKPGLEMDARMQAVLKDAGNQVCADCPATKPLWASFMANPVVGTPHKLGVLCCPKCAQHHHFVLGSKRTTIKYLKMAHEIKVTDIACLEQSGNNFVNELLEAKLSQDDFDKSLVLDCEEKEAERRAKFIKSKYKKQKYLDEKKNNGRADKGRSGDNKSRDKLVADVGHHVPGVVVDAEKPTSGKSENRGRTALPEIALQKEDSIATKLSRTAAAHSAVEKDGVSWSRTGSRTRHHRSGSPNSHHHRTTKSERAPTRSSADEKSHSNKHTDSRSRSRSNEHGKGDTTSSSTGISSTHRSSPKERHHVGDHHHHEVSKSATEPPHNKSGAAHRYVSGSKELENLRKQVLGSGNSEHEDHAKTSLIVGDNYQPGTVPSSKNSSKDSIPAVHHRSRHAAADKVVDLAKGGSKDNMLLPVPVTKSKRSSRAHPSRNRSAGNATRNVATTTTWCRPSVNYGTGATLLTPTCRANGSQPSNLNGHQEHKTTLAGLHAWSGLADMPPR